MFKNNLNHLQLEKKIGTANFKLAKAILERDEIYSIKIDGLSARALVIGSEPFPYEVNCCFESESLSSHCTCNETGICSHLGALLLKLSEMDYKPKDLFDELQEKKKRISEHNIRSIKLKADTKKPEGYEEGQLLVLSQESELEFSLLLIKEEDELYVKTAFTQDAGNRHYEYESIMESKKLTDKEKLLINRFHHQSESHSIALSQCLEDLVDLQNLTVKTAETQQILSFKKFHEIELNFELKNLYEKGDPLFLMTITLINSKKNLIKTRIPLSEINISHRHILWYNSPRAVIYYQLDQPNLAAFFNYLKEENPYYTFTRITQLKNLVTVSKLSQVNIPFDLETIMVISQAPETSMKLKEENGLLRAECYFMYQKNQIHPKDTMSFIVTKNEESSKELVLIKRQFDYEKQMLTAIEKHIQSHLDRSFFESDWPFYLEMALNDFFASYGPFLLSKGIQIQVNQKDVKRKASLVFRVSHDLDWFKIKSLVQDEETATREPVIFDPELLKKGIVKTQSGYLQLEDEEVRKLISLYQSGIDTKEGFQIARINISPIDMIYDQIENKDNDDLFFCRQTMEDLRGLNKIRQAAQPRSFTGTLRSYQQAGYNWLLFLHRAGLNGCLADDMGLGKTIQTLAFMQKLKEMNQLSPSLLVVPIVTLSNWEDEMSRFTPEIMFIRHAGPRRAKTLKELLGFEVIIVTYHTLRNDIELFQQFEFSYIILDEAHQIKNSSSQVFRSVRLLKSQHRLSLTGTPIENTTLELWSQMNFLNPGLLGSKKKFHDNFVKAIEKQDDGDKADILRKTIYPFILRRKKEDVLEELPDKEESVFWCEMDNKQSVFYHELREYYRDQINRSFKAGNSKGASSVIFESLLKLRQAALFPGMVGEDFETVESCKFQAFKEIAARSIEGNHRMLVFSQFIGSLERIGRYFKKQDIPYLLLTGASKDRGALVKEFQTGDSIPFFLISLKAGGVGITLTKADYVVLFDPWWNPALESQAIDRSHRMGQKNPVLAYKMIVRDTIEEKVLRLQHKKQKIASDLITEEPTIFKELTKKDILDLFSK
ncbi:MAG: DEAD/DEAH box helicase family protein [Spirochaetales bacterium]|nr:DEAD/DEAH box helicase family protein [Spirochaetales bacterium]